MEKILCNNKKELKIPNLDKLILEKELLHSQKRTFPLF